MILIDAGPLVALCNERDALHTTAMAELAEMKDAPFAVCEAVLVEACFQLMHTSRRRRLRTLLTEFDIDTAGNTADPAFWADAFNWMEKYAEHAPDWADACISVLSGLDRKLKVWTYDREFRTVWRRPDGSAIPLATKR